jgi:hypothetical protein
MYPHTLHLNVLIGCIGFPLCCGIVGVIDCGESDQKETVLSQTKPVAITPPHLGHLFSFMFDSHIRGPA